MLDLDAPSLQPGLLGSSGVVHYEEREPPAELRALVDRLYVLETGSRAQFYPVVADACVDLVFDCRAGRPAVASFSLCRPVPATVDAGLCLVGVRLRPGGIGRLLKAGPASWDGALHELGSLPLADRWRLRSPRGEPDRLIERLCDQLEAFASPSAEREDLASLMDGLREAQDRPEAARGLSRFSDRHRRRLMLRHAGLSPKRFERVRRFQRSLLALAQQPKASLAGLAAEFGYSDQAHLNHDWRALSGAAPGVWRGRFLQASARPPA